MHNISMDDIEMTLDVMKYTLSRITAINPELGSPKKEEASKNRWVKPLRAAE